VRLFAAVLIALTSAIALAQGPPPGPASPHNVILFVPDGLRALKVDATTAPVMAALRDRGVAFANPHSLFPTFTTANASAMATGHYFGDTGNFSNTIFSAFASPAAGGSVVPFLENDLVLGEMDERFGGNYLNETTVLEAARLAGLSTAVIGKLGPALIFDHHDRAGSPTIVVDDLTGTPGGIPLSDEMTAGLRRAGLPLQAPARGENGRAGSATTPGTLVPNAVQQDYFVALATRVILPLFAERRRPFVLVFWSRDPDGSQHNQGDSLNQLAPGINGPTSRAGIKNADDDLAGILQSLDALGLAASTDVVISADHGFSAISKESRSSPAARVDYADVPRGLLPPGFVALDLAKALDLPLFDPDNTNAPAGGAVHPKRSSGLIGRDARHPDVIVAGNGGSDLIYLPSRSRPLAQKAIAALLAQDYTSGIFVDDALGAFAGTLPLSAINLEGTAVTPRPSIVISFRSTSTGCPRPVTCAAEIADTTSQQGQGMHGSFGRADTMNFMAAAGPDFKSRFVDPVPASNADIGRTLARLLGLRIEPKGALVGRVLTEALRNGAVPAHASRTMRSTASPSGLRTVLRYQVVGRTRYFDAAGFAGRTIGLESDQR
jgi:hypothetical protein